MNSLLIELFVAAYLIGSIPVGVLYARAHGIDILKFGSGNPGATNVGRALGRKGFAVVFLLDVLKGALPAGVAQALLQEAINGMPAQLWWFATGFVAVMGHCFSPFLKFKGGKGIATSLGAGVGSAPLVALPAFGLFLIVFAATKYVSLSSILAVTAAVILAATVPGQAREIVPIFGLLAAFIIYRHRSNIKRLLNGTEPKYNLSKKKDAENGGEEGALSPQSEQN